jgi:hypothetical protein
VRLVLVLLVVACSSPPGPERERLAQLRADVAKHPAGKRRFGVVVEPFGAQRPDAVQAWVNARVDALRACLPDPALGVVVSWDASRITEVVVMSPRGERSAPAERCLAAELATSRLARPVAAGRLYLVAAAL